MLKVQTGVENKVLRDVSVPVETLDAELATFMRNMRETMIAEKGVGLAAPQVGRNIRAIVVMLNIDTPEQVVLPMINPEIVFKSVETECGEEGCLSIPGKFDQVRRFKDITVKFLSLAGEEQLMKLSGFNARVVQHEIDHLDGVLFVDRIEKGPVLGMAAKQGVQF